MAQPPLSQFQWYEKIWFFESHRTKYLEFPYLWRSHHYHNFSEMKEYDFLNYTELKIFNKVQNNFSLKLYNQFFFNNNKKKTTVLLNFLKQNLTFTKQLLARNSTTKFLLSNGLKLHNPELWNLSVKTLELFVRYSECKIETDFFFSIFNT